MTARGGQKGRIKMSNINLESFECPRCLGGGEVVFRHIDGGRCFQCDGTGRVDSLRAQPIRNKATGYALVRPYADGYAFWCGAQTWAEALVERAARPRSVIAKYRPNGSLIFRDGSDVKMASLSLSAA
jgi:hypothetical protein